VDGTSRNLPHDLVVLLCVAPIRFKMRTFWKQLLLVVWLIGQTLGFGMTGICHESGYYAQASALCQQILPANCGYDALPDEAIHGYDCPAHPASAYDYPINHSAGSEKPSSEGIRPLFASTAGFLAAEGTAARAASGDFYSVAFRTTLDPASYPGLSRAAHFQEANEALLTAMESDPQFAQTMQQAGVNLDRTATGLAPRTPPEGWTWHHAEDPGVMQLVPRVQHTPGSIFWDTLHPGGQGGYAIWGKQ